MRKWAVAQLLTVSNLCKYAAHFMKPVYLPVYTRAFAEMMGFYAANTFAEKLICQFLGGKDKLPIINICSCICEEFWALPYSHIGIYNMTS